MKRVLECIKKLNDKKNLLNSTDYYNLDMLIKSEKLDLELKNKITLTIIY